MNEKPMRKLLTTAEVAEHLRTSPETVRYWRTTGYGPQGRKVGRRVLYDADEVEAFWADLPSRDVTEKRP